MRGVPLIYKRKLEQVRFSGGILPQVERNSGKCLQYSSPPMLRLLHYHPLFCLTLIYTFQGRNMVYGLRAQSPKYDWDQGSHEKAQGSEEWDQGSQGF